MTKKIVIKIGSNVFYPEGESFDGTIASELAAQIAEINEAGYQCILVVSGAVAEGRLREYPHSSKALIASIGQVRLSYKLSEVFSNYYETAQILMTQSDFLNTEKTENLKKLVQEAEKTKILLIFNENDPIEENSCGGNDALASQLACLLNADKFVILSDIEGVYDDKMQVIPVMYPACPINIAQIVKDKTTCSYGGIKSKIVSAEAAACQGIPTVIACARNPQVLEKVILHKENLGTHFLSADKSSPKVYNLISQLQEAKQAANIMANLSTERKNILLQTIIDKLKQQRDQVFQANRQDVELAQQANLTSAFVKRLEITPAVFDGMISQIQDVIALPDPVGNLLMEKNLTNGLKLQKISVPLGVIGIIYESRPNVTIETASLCIKSGNVVVLKGGSEAIQSNRALVKVIKEALIVNQLPEGAVLFLDTTDRQVVNNFIKQNDYLDLIIPRGGYGLVKHVTASASVPVLAHASGGARIYVDKSADAAMATAICTNAKTGNPAACNSLDTVVVHEEIASVFLPKLAQALSQYKVKIIGDATTRKIIECVLAVDTDYTTEFLDYILSVKVVKNCQEALEFIDARSHRHSEGVIATNPQVITEFTSKIDAAALFVNCSTRFHDGGMLGLGAEMGIATGKMHTRGPVGLQELTIFKRIITGTGQIRN